MHRDGIRFRIAVDHPSILDFVENVPAGFPRHSDARDIAGRNVSYDLVAPVVDLATYQGRKRSIVRVHLIFVRISDIRPIEPPPPVTDDNRRYQLITTEEGQLLTVRRVDSHASMHRRASRDQFSLRRIRYRSEQLRYRIAGRAEPVNRPGVIRSSKLKGVAGVYQHDPVGFFGGYRDKESHRLTLVSSAADNLRKPPQYHHHTEHDRDYP